MASTSTASSGYTGSASLTEYLRAIAEPNRYRNYEFRQFGTEAIQPNGTGMSIVAPNFTNGVTSLRGSAVTGTASEYTRTTPRSLAFGEYNGTLEYYKDVIGISKVFASTATLRNYLERAAQFLMVGCAKTEDELIQEALFWDTWSSDFKAPSGAYTLVEGDGTTGGTWGDISTETLIPEAFAAARRELRNNNNPGFSELDGAFAALISPTQSYSLLTNVAGSGVQLTFEVDSMGMGDVYRNNSLGQIFGVKLIETSNPVRGNGGITDDPFTSGNAFECAVVLAPDAFYCASHETLDPNLHYSGFKVDAYTPAAEEATLAIDYMFDAFAGDSENKMVVIPTAE